MLAMSVADAARRIALLLRPASEEKPPILPLRFKVSC
jgi:hypothetical protein